MSEIPFDYSEEVNVMPNAIQGLLHSRKFLLLLLDTVVSLLTYFVGKYAGAATQDVLFFIASLQPVFVMVIHGITAEDVAKHNADAQLEAARIDAAAWQREPKSDSAGNALKT